LLTLTEVSTFPSSLLSVCLFNFGFCC
jgi:hypothetical protein